MDIPNTKRAGRAVTVSPIEPSLEVAPDRIARRAYQLFEERGGLHGHDVDDWLEAERELRPGGRSSLS